jgi:hypothetical protein
MLSYCTLFGDDRIKIIDGSGQEVYKYVSSHEFSNDRLKQEQLKNMVESLRKFAEFFADVAVQSFEIQKFPYVLQGIYSILAARDVLGVKPVWNKQLDKFTGLSKHTIKDTIHEVRKCNLPSIDQIHCQ